MKRQAKIDVPHLLLDFDGYSVETVLTGPWFQFTAWILLHKDHKGRVSSVARGWNRAYERARTDAYEAFIEHKRLEGAKDA